MTTIYKYVIHRTEYQTIELPLGAKPLSVQRQGDDICMWVWINKEEKATSIRTVRLFGTGWPMPDAIPGQYLGTVQDIAGYVWHVWVD